MSILAGTIMISSTGFADFIEEPNVGEAITLVANRLDNAQRKHGPDAGTWRYEEGYTGSIVAGMAVAYQRTCVQAYRTSAELGGSYIQGIYPVEGLSGDEAYALALLSEISDDPTSNTWRDTLTDFYGIIENYGTSDYIAWYESNLEPSTAVFFVAHLALAAYYVDSNDKEIWRDSLISFLAGVDDDTAYYPVLALGVTTWVLAQTGPLDSTPVDPGGSGRPYWDSVTLADLPALIVSHQVEPNDPNEWFGSFYLNFVHEEEYRGFTEETVFAVLGLTAAQRTNPELGYDVEILDAKLALFNALLPDVDGTVYAHIWGDSSTDYLYAGEMLVGLDSLVIDGDFDLDDVVNGSDLVKIAENWLGSCANSCLCSTTDIDKNCIINFIDYAFLAKNWLRSDLVM
ncbi:MAG: hypothetical protein ACYSWZ_00265 [Planctomycetota bacterium]|jgi:hypothetical protein